MINSFYNALIGAETWFFGALMQDAFFSGVVGIVNAILLLSMFYGVIILPLKWALSFITTWIKGGLIND